MAQVARSAETGAEMAAAEMADSWLLLLQLLRLQTHGCCCGTGSGTLGTGSQDQVVEPPGGIVTVKGTVYWTTHVRRRNIDLFDR